MKDIIDYIAALVGIAFVCGVGYGVYDYSKVKTANEVLVKENADFKNTVSFTNKRNIELVAENAKLRNITLECKNSVETIYKLKDSKTDCQVTAINKVLSQKKIIKDLENKLKNCSTEVISE